MLPQIMLNFLYIGVGQCGNKLADTFASFKGKAVALNTTEKDMTCLANVEKGARLNIAVKGTTGGAGKTPLLGQKAMTEHLEEVISMIESVGDNADYYAICGGLGGGTGSGGIPVLLHRLLSAKRKVMLILTLPSDDEGAEVQINAYNSLVTILKIIDGRDVPYILIDNNKIQARMKSTADFDWRSVNLYLGKIISQFNRDANKDSPYATFDETDYKKVMYQNGMLALVKARLAIEDVATGKSIADAVMAEWGKPSFYVDFQPASATMLTTIVWAPSQFLEDKTNYKLIEDSLHKLRSECGTVNPYGGIYPYDETTDTNKKSNIIVYCLLTGMKAPTERLDALRDRATKDQEALRKKAGENQVDLSSFESLGSAIIKPKRNEVLPPPPTFSNEGGISDLDFL